MSKLESIFTNEGLAEVAAILRQRGDNPFGIEPMKLAEHRCAIESCPRAMDAAGKWEGSCLGVCTYG